jgi:hypothetical protein
LADGVEFTQTGELYPSSSPADSPDLVLVFAGTEQEFRRRSTKARVVVAGGGVVLLDLRGDPLPDLPPTLVAACGGVGACGVRRWWREWR